MKQLLYQVDAFADAVFAGNPAAVLPLEEWPEDALLQAIAAENNLSETACFAPEGDGWRLRWFTPVAEVDLCGHATLATAHVLFHELGETREELRFASRSGELRVRHHDGVYAMDFPADPPSRDGIGIHEVGEIGRALGETPDELLGAADWCAVFAREEQVRELKPDMAALTEVGRRGVIATAPGKECDFVSRFFVPALGIPEDPVTGSAHCQLAPYWAERLGREELHARQISARGGTVHCHARGDRVELRGRAVTYLRGEILLP